MSSNLGKRWVFVPKNASPTRHSEPLLDPRADYFTFRAIADGWSIVWRACLPYLLIAVAFGGYYVIAKSQGWVP